MLFYRIYAKVNVLNNFILMCKFDYIVFLLDLNQLEVREPRQRLCIEPGGSQNYVIRKVMDISDHVLAVGLRYQMSDFKSASAAPVGIHTSGVLSKYLFDYL